jgi:hypothetical protein
MLLFISAPIDWIAQYEIVLTASPQNTVRNVTFGGFSSGLDVDPLFSIAIQIPARCVAHVGKQGMDAVLVLRIVRKHELGLIVLLVHCVIPLHLHRPIRIYVAPHSVAQL